MVIRATYHVRAEEAGFDRSRSLPSKEVGVIPQFLGSINTVISHVLHGDPGAEVTMGEGRRAASRAAGKQSNGGGGVSRHR